MYFRCWIWQKFGIGAEFVICKISSFRNVYRQSRSSSFSVSRSVSLRVERVDCLDRLLPRLRASGGTLTRWKPRQSNFLRKFIHTVFNFVVSAAVRRQACTLKVRRLLTQAVGNFTQGLQIYAFISENMFELIEFWKRRGYSLGYESWAINSFIRDAVSKVAE